MNGFEFQHTIYLYGLALIPLLALVFWLHLRWKKKVAKKIGDAALVKELTANHSPQRYNLKFILVIVALAGCILALANLHRPGGSQNINRKGIDVVFALDVSKSMLAEDIKPNRLERAKLLINRLGDKLTNDKIGLVLFAGRAYMQMPLTTDHATARIMVGNAQPESAPTQGTALAEALERCNESFSTNERKYKAVVLLTDGEDHDGKAKNAAQMLSDSGAVVYTVGIGSEEGSPIMDPQTRTFKKDAEGNNVISKLNVPLLQEIAAVTGGKYLLYTDTEAVVNQLAKELGGMESRTIEDKTFINYESTYFIFLLVALVLLLAEWALPETAARQKQLKPAL